MNDQPSAVSERTLPPWLTEAADVLWARRRLVIAAAVATVAIGILGSVVAPSLLPPRAIVGAAVGIAAVLLAAAIGLAVDAADLVVRGARHVRAAGADVAATVGKDVKDVGPLLARVAVHARDGRIRAAVVPASRDAGAPGARAAVLAEALARTGRRVLVTDLTRPPSPTPGLSEVVTGERRLAEVAHLEDDLYLARVPVGTNPAGAIQNLAEWVDHLPSDLEVLVVALPPLAEPGVMAAAAVADVLLIQVEADRTERVDLIAALDAVDAAGLTAEVILVDPARSWTERPSSPAPAPVDVLEAGDQAATGHADADGDAVAEPEVPILEDLAEDLADDLDEDGVVAVDEDDDEVPDFGYDEAVAADTSEIPVPPPVHRPRDLAHVWDEDSGASDSVTQPEPIPDPEPVPVPEPEPVPVPEPEPIPDPEPVPVPEPEPVPVPEPEPIPVPESEPVPQFATASARQAPPAATGDVDDLAREAVRTAAALYALAEEVWRREDDGQ